MKRTPDSPLDADELTQSLKDAHAYATGDKARASRVRKVVVPEAAKAIPSKSIRTKAGHKAALARVSALLNAEPGSPGEEELLAWSALIHEYEEKHYPIAPPTPEEARRFRLEQGGP